MTQLKESARSGDKHVTDKGAYRVSSIMGQGGMNLFGQQRVTEVAACLVSGSFGTTDKGSMDAMANHLKCDGFRSAVWEGGRREGDDPARAAHERFGPGLQEHRLYLDAFF